LACAAQQRGDQFYCTVCRLQWDRDDPSPPACGREARDRDPKLSREEITALEVAEDRWFNRERRARRGHRAWRSGALRIREQVGRDLLALGLLFQVAGGAVKTSFNGIRWLDRNTGREPRMVHKKRGDR
jgi:hypothetical protein